MKSLLAAVLGRSPDAAAAGSNSGNGVDITKFVGLWNGTLTTTVNGQTTSNAAYTHITANGSDLTIGDVCGSAGPTATATSPTAFSIHPYVCPAIATTICNSVVVTTTGGGGSLSGTTLTLTLPGTVAGCSQTAAFTISFTGTR